MRTTRAIGAVTLALAVLVAPPASAHTLSYGTAKRAAQKRADAFAGKRVTVHTLIRQTRHRYYVQTRWTKTEQVPCAGCGYDPATGQVYDTTTPTTRHCSAYLSVRFRSSRSRRVVARITDSACF